MHISNVDQVVSKCWDKPNVVIQVGYSSLDVPYVMK